MTALAINAKWYLLTAGALVPITPAAMADRFTGAPQCTVPISLAFVTPKRFGDVNIHLDYVVSSFDLARE
jgi:hypothetical protein